MVSLDSPQNNPSSSMLHQFIISESNITGQNNFDNNLYAQSVHMLGERMSRSMDLFGAVNDNNHQTQSRLSLSLGNVGPSYWVPGGQMCNDAGYNSFPVNQTCSTLNCSRYLKAAQSLLEEFVNLGSIKEINGSRHNIHDGLASELKAQFCDNYKYDQVRIPKLIALLEEVENRYEKYYNQMEQVVSSFEEIGGKGAAKSYTHLALQAMSRHFASLKDAILSQINACRQEKSPKINRMSLQQLGLIPSKRQALRPIRGLPETSVLILRSWLFEHFLHPYPNDSEKLMLASQTGLSKNQVSNWFINARVRLWKPMIEEMYKEEFADSSDESNPLMPIE